MKKLVCLLAVLALAASASATVEIITNGIIQSPWMSVDSTSGNKPYENSTAPDSTPAAYHNIQTTGWTEVRFGGAQISTEGNKYLEFDVYFASTGVSSRFDALQIAVDGAGQWDTKYQYPTDCWIDGVYYDGLDQYANSAANQDKWVHYKIDLTTNISPTDMFGDPIPRNVTTIGQIGLVGYWAGTGQTMDAYISNMSLTPEPATIALLGFGGLALIRRKR